MGASQRGSGTGAFKSPPFIHHVRLGAVTPHGAQHAATLRFDCGEGNVRTSSASAVRARPACDAEHSWPLKLLRAPSSCQALAAHFSRGCRSRRHYPGAPQVGITCARHRLHIPAHARPVVAFVETYKWIVCGGSIRTLRSRRREHNLGHPAGAHCPQLHARREFARQGARRRPGRHGVVESAGCPGARERVRKRPRRVVPRVTAHVRWTGRTTRSSCGARCVLGRIRGASSAVPSPSSLVARAARRVSQAQ